MVISYPFIFSWTVSNVMLLRPGERERENVCVRMCEKEREGETNLR